MEAIREWVEDSPYCRFLGVRLDHLDENSARIVLPYKDENSNPGQALHGGCAASLGAIGGQAVARAALGPESGPWHICDLQVSYLAAAIGEDVVADAKLLRRGKQLCFVNVEVHTPDGKPIAFIATTVRGRFGAEPDLTLGGEGITRQPAGVLVVDLDGDGDVDIVSVNKGSDDVAVFYGGSE